MTDDGCFLRKEEREFKLMGSNRVREIKEIAREIEDKWKKVNYAARPYLDAMHTLSKITDNYICDSGRSVVLYFLSNARTWRGPDAKRIKAELKKRLEE